MTRIHYRKFWLRPFHLVKKILSWLWKKTSYLATLNWYLYIYPYMCIYNFWTISTLYYFFLKWNIRESKLIVRNHFISWVCICFWTKFTRVRRVTLKKAKIYQTPWVWIEKRKAKGIKCKVSIFSKFFTNNTIIIHF